jgi:PAS domain S-box-containing protein
MKQDSLATRPNLNRYFRKYSESGLIIVGLATILVLGLIDYLTPSQLTYTAFYLVPVAVNAWFGSRRAGALVATAGVLTQLTADLIQPTALTPIWIPFANAGLRWGIYATVVFLLPALKTLNQQLEQKVQERTAALTLEIAERQQAEENAHRQARELALLNIIRTALASEVELTELFRVVVEATAKTLGYTQVSLYLRQNEVLQLQHQIGNSVSLPEIPITRGSIGQCARTGSLIYRPDVHADPDFAELRASLTSQICVPLFDGYKPIGVLNIESVTGVTLTEADVRLLSAVGLQVNIGIQRARLYAELSDRERRYKELVNNASDIIYKTDARGHFTFVNPVAERIIGYPESEVLGRYFLQLIQPDYRQPAAKFYIHQFRNKILETYYEFPALPRDGSAIWLGQNVRLILNDAGDRIVETQAIARDITDLKLAESALRQHAIELDARNVELDAFAHTVAHDLKSPISAITGLSELLLDRNPRLTPEQESDALHSIYSSGRKMNALVEELMLLAGLRQQEVQPEPIEMSPLIGETLNRLALAIKESNADIILPQSDDWPIAIGYAPWIEEVWINYISNAIKYGGQPPQVELGAARQVNDTVRFWVRDNGGGLTPEEQARLFTPFTRLNQVSAKGHGLGLSIVKRIVEKLGGTVGVESEIGTGSTFYFTLPGARSS